MSQRSLLESSLGTDCMFDKLKGNFRHTRHYACSECTVLSWQAKDGHFKIILVFSFIFMAHKTFWIIYVMNIYTLMDHNTIALVLSQCDITGVPITIHTLFGRFVKRKILHLLFYFSLNKNIDIRWSQNVLSPILLVLFRDFEGGNKNFWGHFGKLYKYHFLTPTHLFVLLEASEMSYFKAITNSKL